MSLFGPPNVQKLKTKSDIRGLIKPLLCEAWLASKSTIVQMSLARTAAAAKHCR